MSGSNSYGHPAWFGSVMGTGALGLAFASQTAAYGWRWTMWIAIAFMLLASVFALVLLPRYVLRLRDRSRLRTELADPGHGTMLSTLPAGLLVLAVDWGRIGLELVPDGAALTLAAVLLATGTVLALGLGWAWATAMLSARPGLAGVNGGWLIPPVMNMLVPLALAPLIVVQPQYASLGVLVGFMFLGMGFVLFMAVIALLITRLALHEPMPDAMAPSLWIPLAPAGVMGLSMLKLMQAADSAQVPGFSGVTAGVVVSAMGIGFGLWWAGFASIELQRIRRAGGPPLHPGWWGFVFPIAAMTIAVSAVGTVTDVWLMQAIGFVATCALTALWVYIAVVTARLATHRPIAPKAVVPD